MTGKQLKNSILQLAIQGKLVPQDPNDEPASALLARIRKEKDQLVKDGKLKKKDLVTTPISDEEKPFEIPESWEWCRLYNVGITNTGTTPSKSNPKFFGDYIPFLGPGDIQNSTITYGKNGLSKLGYEVARPVVANSIIQVCIGGSIGKCAIVDRESTFNQQINSLTALVCCHKYLFYCMQSDFFVKQMIENSTGTATPIINRGSWDLLLIPLPPLDEQHRIVAKIEELMPLVEEYDKAQTKLDALNQKLPEALKKSILQVAIMGKLVPQDPNDEPASKLLARIRKEKEQLVKDGKLKKKDLITTPISDDEKPFEIPETWEWCRFCELFAIFNGDRGKNYPSKDKLQTEGIPFISALNLNNNTVVKDDRLLCLSEEQYNKLNGGKLEKGDNVICIRGSLGKHGVFPFERGAIASSLVIAKNIGNSVIPRILGIYLDSPLFFEQIKLYNNGTAQPNLAAKSLENFLFPLPPLSEQHRIVAKIEELFSLI